jgi:arylsulfatase A-like enzyme
MKAILVIFDSLSKSFLPPYGNDWVHAPNFQRLSRRSVTFGNCFAGSLPCMPARRELHTGRYNFLHRSWGPLEPFDDSMPELLKQSGVYTHLVSDHYHYWEDGGSTYHNRYSSWESVRGQEGDPWKGEVAAPEIPNHIGVSSRQDWVNRKYMQTEDATTQARTFDLGLEFIETNQEQDNWLLQIECFDPHPPFSVPEKYEELYSQADGGPLFDWPPYGLVTEESAMVEKVRRQYAALVSMCDHSLGRVLDAMDRNSLWGDTMLIVTTDHGFHLGEHGWWAFVKPPMYNTAAQKPLFIWDPRCGKQGVRNQRLVQMIDMPATIMEYFGQEFPPDMQGIPLGDTTANDRPVREACLFGVFGGHVNCTDGRYVYMRAPTIGRNEPLFNYTLMPTHMRHRFSLSELRSAERVEPFAFTKGCPVLRTPGKPFMQDPCKLGTLLFDLHEDPAQDNPIQDPVVERRMSKLMVQLMKDNDAPAEQFGRLGLTR